MALKNSGTSIHFIENGNLRQKSKRRHAQQINVDGGIKFSDLILSPPSLWNLDQLANLHSDTLRDLAPLP